MRPFEEVEGRFVARLTRDERYAVAQVAEQVVELLEQEVDGLAEVSAAIADESLPASLLGLGDGHVEGPVDPAVRRLLPDAAPTDPAVAGEFRRLTQTDLAVAKVARLTALVGALVGADEPGLGGFVDDDEVEAEDLAGDPVLEGLGWREVAVEPTDAQSFAGALTDVRLVLADRLGVATDADAVRLGDAVEAAWQGEAGLDPRTELLGSVFVLTGFLQESLLDLMLARLRASRPGR